MDGVQLPLLAFSPMLDVFLLPFSQVIGTRKGEEGEKVAADKIEKGRGSWLARPDFLSCSYESFGFEDIDAHRVVIQREKSVQKCLKIPKVVGVYMVLAGSQPCLLSTVLWLIFKQRDGWLHC